MTIGGMHREVLPYEIVRPVCKCDFCAYDRRFLRLPLRSVTFIVIIQPT